MILSRERKGRGPPFRELADSSPTSHRLLVARSVWNSKHFFPRAENRLGLPISTVSQVPTDLITAAPGPTCPSPNPTMMAAVDGRLDMVVWPAAMNPQRTTQPRQAQRHQPRVRTRSARGRGPLGYVVIKKERTACVTDYGSGED